MKLKLGLYKHPFVILSNMNNYSLMAYYNNCIYNLE